MSIIISEISSKKSIIYNSDESSEIDSECMDNESNPQVTLEFDDSYKHKEIYYDYCIFGDYILKIYYFNPKHKNMIPKLYRLTLNGNFNKIDKFRKLSLNHFFRLGYQDIINNFMDIIGKIHKSNIREIVRSKLDSKKNKRKLFIESLFEVPDLDTEYFEDSVEVKFKSPYSIVSNTGGLYIGSNYLRFYLGLARTNKEPTVTCKLFFNGDIKIHIFFENNHIRDQKFYRELTSLKIDKDYYE